MILLHTGGQVDILNQSSIAKAVLYSLSMPMTSSLAPCGTCTNSNANFGDDEASFSPAIIQYLSNVFLSTNLPVTSPILSDVSGQSMTWWPYGGSDTRLNISGVQSQGVYSIRSFFSSVGVLTSRPDANNTGNGMFLTAKALGDATLIAGGGEPLA